jgi:hypothetical protein
MLEDDRSKAARARRGGTEGTFPGKTSVKGKEGSSGQVTCSIVPSRNPDRSRKCDGRDYLHGRHPFDLNYRESRYVHVPFSIRKRVPVDLIQDTTGIIADRRPSFFLVLLI